MPYIPASSKEADTRPRPGAAQRPPGELLAQAAQLAEQAQLVVERAVIAERAKGTSWEVIGEILGGVSKSAAHKRWGTTVARWRESAEIARRLPDAPPDDLVDFSLAYDELEGAWKQATEIVDRQPLLADLNNATVALSGSPGVRTGTGNQQNFHSLPAARLCAQEPDSRQINEIRSLLDEVLRARTAEKWDAARALGAQAVEAFLTQDRPTAGADPVRDAQDLDAVRARGAQAVDAILAQEERALALPRATDGLPEDGRDNPENADRELEPHAAWAVGKYRRDYSRESRRRNVERAYAEFQRQGLTLGERVTRLENAFEDLLTDELERP
ncbi:MULTISPECIES: hypothetical protein [unclassified Streptomyces]|uniref:hypothetical protein n=1 Tax=unclassified Streptomyces TaxID=2593676 RepID=UPI002252EF2F|nr:MULTISPECIES: hypothetical protein [unclassified Streptomyces]MCX4406444.1 hypothetical protein [Streptomyces sp. NBC_01764]MCX5189032.1 hypothetical protein [Streptomyces sp. NBC_00268]